jgi:hypothetical protein
MDLVTGYSIAFCAFLALYPLWKFCRLLVRWLRPLLLPFARRALRPLSRHISKTKSRLPVILAFFKYGLVIHRRYWMSITLLEFLALCLYFGGNATALYLGKSNLASTAGMLAIINATPLFFAGRTNFLADLLGIPLSTYFVFHHFIGRVAVAEGLLHAGLVLPLSQRDQVTTSGYIVRHHLVY